MVMIRYYVWNEENDPGGACARSRPVESRFPGADVVNKWLSRELREGREDPWADGDSATITVERAEDGRRWSVHVEAHTEIRYETAVTACPGPMVEHGYCFLCEWASKEQA